MSPATSALVQSVAVGERILPMPLMEPLEKFGPRLKFQAVLSVEPSMTCNPAVLVLVAAIPVENSHAPTALMHVSAAGGSWNVNPAYAPELTVACLTYEVEFGGISLISDHHVDRPDVPPDWSVMTPARVSG